MQWLEKLQPPKFLRYMFYKLYMFALKTNNSTPKLAVVITLAFTHLLQIVFILEIVRILIKIDIWEKYLSGHNKITVVLFALFFFFMTSLFYHYKNKHLKYIKEFENQTKAQKRRGSIYLLIYLFISISLLYITGFLLMPINNPNYQ